MNVTIKDIAKLAGVSHTTVSRSLNDSSLISEKTKKRIKEIAVKHGYFPNSNAKSLVLNKSFNIGVFFTTLEYGVTPDYFFQVVRTLQKLLKGKYKLVIRGINDYNNDYYLINSKTFDGIVTVSQDLKDDNFIKHVYDSGLPQVIINRKFITDYADCIYSNEKEIVITAIEHLIAQGHSKICFVKGPASYTSTKDRLSGYTEALQRYSLAINNDYIIEGEYDIHSGYKAMKQILDLHDRPTAIFFGSDNMAFGAMKRLFENNLVVSEDFSIVGFDNAEFSYYLTPSLSTIERPNETIITEGLNCLLCRIESKDTYPAISKCFNSELIIRNSTRKLS